MKDFNRTNLTFSLCGLNCRLCPMGIDGYCPGCGGGPGNQSCAIARCSLQHDKVEYCFLCPEYPCQRYDGIEKFDSFITHQHQLQDMEKAQKIGIGAYNEEQVRKAELLRQLLSDYNDGRRKSFYCLAANLLPLQDLENIIRQIADNPAYRDIPVKEKAEHIAALFQEAASREGVLLKLRKPPDKSKA